MTREYYLNDRGAQQQLFAESLAARQRGDELPPDGYPGEYVTEWAAEMPADADPLEWGLARARQDIRETVERLGIDFDVWFSERSMVDTGAIEAAIGDLRSEGVVYDSDGAVWIRATDFGDDKDRVLIKSDGDYTYTTPDIAYHRDKFDRGYSRLINVWGADHHGAVVRLKAALAALGHDPDDLEIIMTQLVRLERDGEEVKLSKRLGNLVSLDEIVDEVGADATRFTYLLLSTDSHQTFDLVKVAEQSMENPVFYVQMAHARACSIQRNATSVGVELVGLDEADLGLLIHDRELAVLRALSELPDVVAAACQQRSPHQVTTWLRELAATFHGFFHDCWVVGTGIAPELTQARLWLTEAARVGLAIGLDLVGVSAPEEL